MPWTLGDLPFLLLLPLLLTGSALFSGSETALFGLSAHDRMRLTRRKNAVGTAVTDLLAEPRMLLITLMVGNMMMNVGYFVVSSALLMRLDPATVNPLWYAVGTVGPLLAIILIGEVLPKLVANTVRIGWVKATAIPLAVTHGVARPVVAGLSRWVIQPLGRLVAGDRGGSVLTAVELETMLEMSRKRGVIEDDEQALLSQVVHLGRLRVRDIMTPRVDLLAVDVRTTLGGFRALMHGAPRSRYLVYENDLDHIVGVVYVRQALLAERLGRETDLRALARGVKYVPELMRVDQLLTDFRRTGTQLAVAVDEYGGTAGVVTLKDIVEQVVGDLAMEEEWESHAHDEGPEIEQIADRKWRVSGRLSVHDWSEAFGRLELPARVSTVAGLVMALLGRAAQAGDRAFLGNLELTVERAEAGRIDTVILRLRKMKKRVKKKGAAKVTKKKVKNAKGDSPGSAAPGSAVESHDPAGADRAAPAGIESPQRGEDS